MTVTPERLDRRTLLRRAALISAVAAAVPLVAEAPASAATVSRPAPPAPAPAGPGFVASYRTNVAANTDAARNAALRVLSGMDRFWTPGPNWNDGTVRDPLMLRANIAHCVRVTRRRSDEEARLAFLIDRRNQSYSAAEGLGPLRDAYRDAARSVTGIVDAPDGVPPGRIDDRVPPGAPPGSAIGAGSPDSELGRVVTLVNTVRGPFSSTNPSKAAFRYPRPWRLTDDNRVVDTGRVDAQGFPVYVARTVVVPSLLRQRSENPATDDGYPSGHTNALHLACLALAYAVPERFRELVACAFDLSDTRIVAGMHSPLDVVGGRVLATALAAAILADPVNAELKAAARDQARTVLAQRVGQSPDGLIAFARRPGPAGDRYGDPRRNAATVSRFVTYDLPRRGRPGTPMTVPAGAEVLLETRLPYLDAAQRREVLRTTALPSERALLDGPEQWSRLDLYAAAGGYHRFDAEVRVAMDAALGGFHAADTWTADIDGPGRLVTTGSGELTLTGRNRYRGGTRVEQGRLVAAGAEALGWGEVTVGGGGVLAVGADGLRLGGDLTLERGATLSIGGRRGGVITRGSVTIGADTTLEVRIDPDDPPRGRAPIEVLWARRIVGRFARVVVSDPRVRVEVDATDRRLRIRRVS